MLRRRPAWATIVAERMNANEALSGVWKLGQLPPDALRHAMLSGADPVLPSSFAVGTAAQVSIAAAALAACELGHARGHDRQDVHVDMLHAALECVGWFSIDGRVPEVWDKISGLYRCADGWVRIHANFAHHREGALRLLGLPPETAQRADAERALRHGARWISSKRAPITDWWLLRCAVLTSGTHTRRGKSWRRSRF